MKIDVTEAPPSQNTTKKTLSSVLFKNKQNEAPFIFIGPAVPERTCQATHRQPVWTENRLISSLNAPAGGAPDRPGHVSHAALSPDKGSGTPHKNSQNTLQTSDGEAWAGGLLPGVLHRTRQNGAGVARGPPPVATKILDAEAALYPGDTNTFRDAGRVVSSLAPRNRLDAGVRPPERSDPGGASVGTGGHRQEPAGGVAGTARWRVGAAEIILRAAHAGDAPDPKERLRPAIARHLGSVALERTAAVKHLRWALSRRSMDEDWSAAALARWPAFGSGACSMPRRRSSLPIRWPSGDSASDVSREAERAGHIAHYASQSQRAARSWKFAHAQ